MLDAFLGLDLGVDFGGSSSYNFISLLSYNLRDMLSPAAAAASNPPFFAESVAGLLEVCGRGLRLRLDSGSGFEAGGERDLRSNLLLRFGSV